MSLQGVAPEGEVLWAGGKLRIVQFNPGCEKLIVTFDHFNPSKSGFPPCEASKLFTENGFTNLRLQTVANDWYINSETEEMEAVLRGLSAPYALRTALGYSMGGYAAIRFHAALRLNWVVAISPQVSLARADGVKEWRWKESQRNFDAKLGQMRPHADTILRGLVLYDPMISHDRAHANTLQNLFPGLALVPLSFAGHPASPLLAEMGQSGLVRQAALEPEFAAKTCLSIYRQGRRGALKYWQNRMNKTAQRRPLVSLAARGAVSALSGKSTISEQ